MRQDVGLNGHPSAITVFPLTSLETGDENGCGLIAAFPQQSERARFGLCFFFREARSGGSTKIFTGALALLRAWSLELSTVGFGC